MELTLLEASGVADTVAHAASGAQYKGVMYFSASAQVAPMFRPPDGDLILSADGHALNVWDRDLQNATELARQSLEVRWPTWSPRWSHDHVQARVQSRL